ncbi:IS3 family transposase ISBxe1 [Paraburkholderia caffeinitolerans]|uniref:IS3 family transposase ISBxe1 n=1 Tax=Paraburkholderia caffeinitolerans TaxID=1723730 RepID=A0A6J5GYX8_9BURK|nr:MULTISPECIES: IS3 family transposase [Paraburkholderia]CAB3809570.1 IS3 family transposase ISBxe1 [Paraburkholderia caffeinitolerans]
MKYAWIERHSRQWPVSVARQTLGVSPSGYHRLNALDVDPERPRRSISKDALLIHIRAVYAESKGERGWPRVWKELLAQGIHASKDRVQRLMKLHSIKARAKRRFKATTDSRHNCRSHQTCCSVSSRRPGCTAITYLWTDEGWLYLTVILDLFSRQVVGWSLKPHMRTELVSDALRLAWFRRRPEAGLILHSDRGSRPILQRRIPGVAQGLQHALLYEPQGQLLGQFADRDLWGSLKQTRIHGRRFATRREATDEVLAWLSFYNHERLHSTLNYISPMQFERSWYAAQRQQAA